MTREQLDAIRARLDAATPGPWTIEEGGGEEDCLVFVRTKRGRVVRTIWLNDATFVAHAPTDLRALLDEVERLKAERDRAVDDCELLVREVHALGAGAVMKSLFNDRQPVAPAGSTPSPAPISDYRKSYAVMFRREERKKLEALAKAERLTVEVERLTAELHRMKSRPCETEFSRLDAMWQQLVRERDEAVFEVRRLRTLPIHENK